MHSEEIDLLLMTSEEAMDKSIEHLNHELAKVRTGKASTNIVNDILVDYYGSKTPMNQVSSVATSDSRTITIQPWEKSMLPVIEKAIFEANLGITPMNDGEMIRLSIPPLTEERRRELVKKVKHLGEEAKIGIRSVRHKAMDGIKKAVKDGYPEDAGKDKEDQVQNMVNKFSKKINALVDAKEKALMTV
ncbi:MAG TPA: ribosome recycling factor [Bacteroidetes bacterium]|nr:ribosome recycling factor [Bacteroidota bacterium]